jgi:UDP-N-acetylglucosamine/UDP-N-acetylgalactosamine 4-epimerase
MEFPENIRQRLEGRSERWLVTGAAGFIGSHLAAALLGLGQTVVGLDNLSTGSPANLEAVRAQVGEPAWRGFTFLRGDVRESETCARAVSGVSLVLHQAALASVPASLADPLACHANNVTGFCNLIEAARQAKVRRVVYASSCAVYGDAPTLPKIETMAVAPLSPYALGKVVNEEYASLYARCFGQELVGLRYFNVYGPRQDPSGAYAAVIPRWLTALARGEAPVIYGDGGSTRDFCFVSDVVRANLLAALVDTVAPTGQVVNIGGGGAISLLELFAAIRQAVAAVHPEAASPGPRHLAPRQGDIRHSLADVTRARELLGFRPTVSLAQGLARTAASYLDSV